MALTTGDRQQIFTRLAPVIGEQEAETLLDQFPATTDTETVTVADLRAAEARLDHRIDMVERRLDAKIDGVEARLDAKIDGVETRLDAKIEILRRDMATGFEHLEKTLFKQVHVQTLLMISTIVAVLGIAARTNLFG